MSESSSGSRLGRGLKDLLGAAYDNISKFFSSSGGGYKPDNVDRFYQERKNDTTTDYTPPSGGMGSKRKK